MPPSSLTPASSERSLFDHPIANPFLAVAAPPGLDSAIVCDPRPLRLGVALPLIAGMSLPLWAGVGLLVGALISG